MRTHAALFATLLASLSGFACTNVTDLAQPSCTYAVTPEVATFNPGGGTGTLNVSTPGVCAWSVAAESPWISFPEGTSGTGSGTVPFTVSSNPAPAPRNASVTIAGQAIQVVQAAADCTYDVEPDSLSFDAGGETESVRVTTSGACEWTATSGEPWIAIARGASGSGSGVVDVRAEPHDQINSRSGTVVVAGQPVTVTQSGVGGSFTVSPASAAFGPDGGAGSFSISAAQACDWSATSDVSWIRVADDSGGSGGGTVSYTVLANAGEAERTGRITVGDGTVVVTQAGRPAPPPPPGPPPGPGPGPAPDPEPIPPPPPCEYTAAPLTAAFPVLGGSGEVVVSTATQCAWTATSTATWILLTSGSGTGPGTVSYTVAPNAAIMARTGTLQVAGVTVTITQAGVPCIYTVTPTSASYGTDADSGEIQVDTLPGCAWTAVSSAGWIRIESEDQSGTGAGDIHYSIDRNRSRNGRTGTITVGGSSVVTITQQGERDDGGDDD